MISNWPEVYLRHFIRFFGKPFDVQVYRQEDGEPLRLATFDRAYPKYLLYASLGLSDLADTIEDAGEVILLSNDLGQAGRRDVPLIFVNALFFIIQKRIPFSSPFSVGGVETVKPEFAEYYHKVALYFSIADGFPEGFEKVERHDEAGLVYQARFISLAEQDYLNRNGPAALEEKLQAQKTDPCSLRRPSCV